MNSRTQIKTRVKNVLHLNAYSEDEPIAYKFWVDFNESLGSKFQYIGSKTSLGSYHSWIVKGSKMDQKQIIF